MKPARDTRKIRYRVVFLSLLIGSLSGGGCQKQPREQVDRTRTVRTLVVKRGLHPRSASLTGEYRARIQSDLSFRIPGRIDKRLVDVGDHVAANDLLATIDSLRQTADLTASQAALRSAEATLEQVRSQVKRIEKLLPSQSATQAEFDDAKAAELTAQGTVNVSKSLVATAQSQRSFTNLYAPSSGIIIARTAEAGQVIAAAQPVFTLAVDGDREAVFEAFQRDIADHPVDDKITLSLVSNPAVTTSGVIREIAPAIDPSSGTAQVKVSIPAPPAEMTLGSPVLGVAQFSPSYVFELPWSVLSRQGDSPAVWIVDPKTQAVSERNVEIDSHLSGVILISHGLEDGDIVVTEGSQLLRTGQVINMMGGDAVKENQH